LIRFSSLNKWTAFAAFTVNTLETETRTTMKSYSIRLLLPTVLLTIVMSGCDGGGGEPETDQTGAATPNVVDPSSLDPTPAPGGQSEDMPPAGDVNLDLLSWEETRALVEKHPGKIVVMDLWSTYCPPCIAEFPNLVKLQQDHGDDVVCISVCLDYDGLEDVTSDTYRLPVLKFLKGQQATFQNVMCTTDTETLFQEKIEHNSMPVVYVFDRQGKQFGQFPDPVNPSEFTYEADVLPLVEKLISE